MTALEPVDVPRPLAEDSAPAGRGRDLRAMSSADLEALVGSLGERPFRARQISRWLHQRGARSFEEMTDLSKALRAGLKERCEIGSLSLARVERARDGTRKYAFRTARGDVVESVFIPDASAEGRNTLCISSQVGCAIDCRFCLTASLGLRRNLNAGEIVEQLTRVKEDLAQTAEGEPVAEPQGLLPDGRLAAAGLPRFRALQARQPHEPPRIHNLVMMGMGEPLHNYEQTVRALHLFSSEDGHAMSPRRITVSTAGLAPRIPRLGRDTQVNLAVSLNATTDEIRDQIMPINRRYDIKTLLAACREFPLPERRRITFEYVLLKGVNDSLEDARRLVTLLRGLRSKVNLIPFNEHPKSPFERPAQAVIDRFQSVLVAQGLSVFVRTARGDDISAACGQLGVEVDRPAEG
ncbi:MAG: radical SAM protein [Deltaproteobacteria bacterium]|nr:radical SAM protein [Deltaproteobacteria bacterium]